MPHRSLDWTDQLIFDRSGVAPREMATSCNNNAAPRVSPTVVPDVVVVVVVLVSTEETKSCVDDDDDDDVC